MSKIRERRIALGLTQKDVANSIGVTEATVSRWESGEIANIRRKKIALLSDLLKLDPSDIMDLPDKRHAESQRNDLHFIRIPVMGRVAGGVPIEQIEDIEGYEDFQAPADAEKEYFALRVRGDSMQPLILDGSIVIVHKQPDAETGEIVIATINGDDATCKRLKKFADGIMLVSVNPAYDPIILKRDDVDNEPVRILGKVVEIRTSI